MVGVGWGSNMIRCKFLVSSCSGLRMSQVFVSFFLPSYLGQEG